MSRVPLKSSLASYIHVPTEVPQQVDYIVLRDGGRVKANAGGGSRSMVCRI
jgi:hypothetical protein